MQQKKIYIESLGCNKNTVDSEVILSILKRRGYTRTDRPEAASCVIVNTCGFIDAAKQEAIDVIFELTGKKSPDAKLIVAGCFSQLYYKEIEKEIPEVDAIIGTGNLETIVSAIESRDAGKFIPESTILPEQYTEYGKRTELLTPRGYAYSKISEGCSRNCSFCMIPHIKGRMRSRPLSSIVEEAMHLENAGIKELILTSQDTLRYGSDLPGATNITLLMKTLLDRTTIPAFRLLYLRPGKELIRHLGIFSNRVLPYFDIPIQHVSAHLLRLMRREGDDETYRRIIGEIRRTIPNAVLRSTLIVGFPGETEEDFQQLVDFIRDVRFNHLGVFVFSPQENTDASLLPHRVDENTALQRMHILLDTQREISRELLSREHGKVYSVLTEERIAQENIVLGRSFHFAPEVDGLFVIQTDRDIEPGTMIHARVTKSDDYDLFGIPAD